MGVLPFSIVDLGLLLKVDVFVEGVIVKFGVLHFLFHGASAVGFVEYVEDLDGVHDHVLFEDVLDDDNRDVRLELKNSIVEMFLWDAMCQKLS